MKQIDKIEVKDRRELIRQSYIEMIKENKPYCLVTLVFRGNQGERQTRRLLDRFLIHLNKEVFKRRYQYQLSFIKGFAVRENAKLMKMWDYSYLDCDHYHVVITNKANNLPDKASFDRKVEKVITYLNKGAKKGIPDAHQFVDEEFFPIRDYQIDDYYNDGYDGLERYVTKNFKSKGEEIAFAADSVGVFSVDRVEFGRDLFSS